MDRALIPLTPLDLAGAPAVPGGDVLLWQDEDGLVVLGAERDRKDLLASLGLATSAAAAGGTVAALASSGGDYFRLTAESAAKLGELGKQTDQNGSMYGFVRSGNRFAGNLRFDQANFAPEQAWLSSRRPSRSRFALPSQTSTQPSSGWRTRSRTSSDTCGPSSREM